MKISVDNIESPSPDQPTIEGIVERISLDLPSDRIIAEVLLDGRPYYLSSIRNLSAESVRELTIRTANRKSWAVGGVELCLTMIPEIKKSMLRVAQSYRDGRIGEAQKSFGRCLDALDRVLANFEITKQALGPEVASLRLQGETAASLELDLRHLLDRILDAQKRKDYSTLADQLEIGLLTHFQRWMSWLQALSENHRSDD